MAPAVLAAGRAGTKYRKERMNGESIMRMHGFRCGSVLLSASVAAAASLIVAADHMDAPAVRIVAASPDDAGQDDNFRSAAVRHGASATDPDHAGIWKAAIPPGGTMHGELGRFPRSEEHTSELQARFELVC